jgi:hypothetical protein
LTFNGLHGVISQKIVLFITIAVRTSNLTKIHGDESSAERRQIEAGEERGTRKK